MPDPQSLDIVCPIRNGGEPLAGTLRALAASEDQGFRLLISDNHSTDGAPWKDALDAFRPGQCVLLRPPEPLGRVEHWTWAARQAEATFCKLLLVGDRLPPNYIGTIRKAFAGSSDIIYTPYIILGRGNSLEEELGELDLRDATTPLSTAEYLLRCRKQLNLIGPLSAVTFRTRSLREALPFDPNHGWTADWRLYTQIMRQGSAVRCEGSYCILDRTIARVSSSFRGVLNGIYEERTYLRELAGKGPASPVERFFETLRPVTAHLLRSTLPPRLYRVLTSVLRRKSATTQIA